LLLSISLFLMYNVLLRLGKRVSRAFSFNKTPSRLKRAVSSVLSPFSHENNHGTLAGTPRRGELFNRRQASCVDLTVSQGTIVSDVMFYTADWFSSLCCFFILGQLQITMIDRSLLIAWYMKSNIVAFAFFFF
jgi:hypothetical protein